MHSSKVHDSNVAHTTRTRMCETNTFKRNWVLRRIARSRGFCVVPRVVDFRWTCAISSTDSSLERQGVLQGFVSSRCLLRVLHLKLLFKVQEFSSEYQEAEGRQPPEIMESRRLVLFLGSHK